MRHWVFVVVLVIVGCSSMVWGQGIQDIVFYDAFESGDTSGWWATALTAAAALSNGTCGLTDGSVAGGLALAERQRAAEPDRLRVLQPRPVER